MFASVKFFETTNKLPLTPEIEMADGGCWIADGGWRMTTSLMVDKDF